jgi:DNA-binding NarL/FixJ family response regulator
VATRSLTRVPENAVRRTKRLARHWQRRARNIAEFNASSKESRTTSVEPRVVIALIDPKPLTRESILNMLGASVPKHVKLLGASDFAELLVVNEAEALGSGEHDLSLVILYIRSAGVADNWVQEQLQVIKTQRPRVPVIIISDRDDADDVTRALNCGARGYIPTSLAPEVAIAALTLIEAGGTYIPADALRAEAAGSQEKPENDEQAHPHVTAELDLTSRELAVIDLLRQGDANKIIARKLNVRESTVKVHVRNILKKLRVSNRTHAATLANRLLANARGATASTDLSEGSH